MGMRVSHMAPLEGIYTSFTTEQLAYAGKAAIDFFLKNDPIDQINTSRPLYSKLVSKKKDYAGGLQYVVEQLRYSNDSNFQAYFGDSQVTYNRKRTLEQAKYSWGSFHDGFGLNEDELTQNGIIMTDDRNAVPSDSEKVQLTNLLKENHETLKLGFQENFDIMLHRDGTQDAEEIPGLDALVSVEPSAGNVGTIAASNAWWQNYVDLDINTPTESLISAAEVAWRACILRGGEPPDFFLCGSDFLDAWRTEAKSDSGLTRQVILGGNGGNMKGATLDAGIGNGTSTGLYFKGIELIWDPVFDTLDTLDAPTEEWSKRGYLLNTKYLTLRPIKGHWLVSRKPPRVYDRYVHYWALTAKAAMTTGKRNAHALLHIA
jgi:hypothetical protein